MCVSVMQRMQFDGISTTMNCYDHGQLHLFECSMKEAAFEQSFTKARMRRESFYHVLLALAAARAAAIGARTIEEKRAARKVERREKRGRKADKRIMLGGKAKTPSKIKRLDCNGILSVDRE